MTTRGGSVLITGATGFVGMEVLARYLERGQRRVVTLVRAGSDLEARDRIDRVLANLFGTRGVERYADRVEAYAGELTAPRLGLDRRRFEELAWDVEVIIHSAASVSFALPLSEAREINVEGTRNILAFASLARACGGLERYGHISTAYVAGTHAGRFAECDLDVGQGFRNSYEQSKFEAECLLARARRQLPVTVMRPSIIVGERATGWTASFNVLYWPLRAFARGTYHALPAQHGAPVDVVPIDYVADAIFELSQAREAEGATFHLTAGAHASCVGELVELATSFFKRPSPRLIDPSFYRRMVHPLLLQAMSDERSRRALVRSEVFFPYFAMRVRFDDRRTRVALRGAGLAATPLASYFDRLIQFALAAEWGRRRISRARATGRWSPSFSQPASGDLVSQPTPSQNGDARLVLAE